MNFAVMWRSSGANGEDPLMVRLEQMPGYLAARFTGIGPLRDVSQQFELIAERCKLTNADQSNFIHHNTNLHSMRLRIEV
jgi:hypothetical protein